MATMTPPHAVLVGLCDKYLAGLMDFEVTLLEVANLVEGFETSFGMELLTTVHWVMAHEGARDEDVVAAVHGWNPRKRMFEDEQIQLAVERLRDEGWLAQA